MSTSRTSLYGSFRHLVFSGAKPPPTPRQIAAIEELVGAELPDSFLDFFRVANGAYLDFIIDVPVGDGTTEELSFCSVFSVEDTDFGPGTVIGEIHAGRKHQGLPRGVLPFARDGGHSMVYLDLSPKGRGRVLAFVAGLPGWTGHRQDSAILQLADSFDGYLDMLRLDRRAVIDDLAQSARTTDHVDATEEYLDLGLPGWRENDEELRHAVTAARRRLSA